MFSLHCQDHVQNVFFDIADIVITASTSGLAALAVTWSPAFGLTGLLYGTTLGIVAKVSKAIFNALEIRNNNTPLQIIRIVTCIGISSLLMNLLGMPLGIFTACILIGVSQTIIYTAKIGVEVLV